MLALPQQIRFCVSHDGVRIAYATSGAGAPLVKAANWLSHLEFDGASPVWNHLLRELSRHNTLVRYDARGSGLSDWDVELSFESWVRDLEAVVEASGSGCFPLLGISQGASIAIAYAVRHLERISTSPVNAGHFMRVLHEIDIVSLLPRVSCPTLVFHCVRDARVPFDEGRLIATMVPGARFVPLESNNHLLLESEPAWSRWIAELRAFLPATATRDAAFEVLTPRERDLVELIAQGRDNAQIAAHLGLSAKTVRNHITSIFAKLEVENRAQAIVLARNAGFGAPR